MADAATTTLHTPWDCRWSRFARRTTREQTRGSLWGVRAYWLARAHHRGRLCGMPVLGIPANRGRRTRASEDVRACREGSFSADA